jgi:hypothetical protein
MRKKITSIFVIIFSVMFFSCSALASQTVGTIDSTNKYSWGENMGWTNFAPQNGDTYSGLVISDTAVTGYAWSREFGWINFSPTNSGEGVVNTSEGHLSGKAWVGTLGWLDFSGVVINSSGKFTGIAGEENTPAGRISFDCEHCNVVTDWRPQSVRTSTSGGGGATIPPAPGGTTTGTTGSDINTVTTQETIPFLEPGGANGTHMGDGGEPVTDPIPRVYTTLDLSLPDRTPRSDYVESYNNALTVANNQQGLSVNEFTDGTTAIVEIPKGSASDTITINVSVSTTNQVNLAGNNYIFGGIIFTVTATDSKGNNVHEFSKPITITFHTPQSFSGEEYMGIYWFDASKNEWVRVPEVTFLNKTVSFPVSHLTEFAIIKTKSLPEYISTLSPKAMGIVPHSLTWLWLLLILILYLYYRTQKKNSKQ